MKAFRNPNDQQVYVNVPDLIKDLNTKRAQFPTETERRVIDYD